MAKRDVPLSGPSFLYLHESVGIDQQKDYRSFHRTLAHACGKLKLLCNPIHGEEVAGVRVCAYYEESPSERHLKPLTNRLKFVPLK